MTPDRLREENARLMGHIAEYHVVTPNELTALNACAAALKDLLGPASMETDQWEDARKCLASLAEARQR